MTRRTNVELISSHLFSDEDMNLFAVLDGASVTDLRQRLYELQPEYECLYGGQLEPDIAEVAPYLVHVEKGTEFADWLIEKGWGNHWGIYAATPVDARSLTRHLRTLSTVYDASGKPMLFRYYDPRVLRVFLPTCTAGELEKIFGPVASYMLEAKDARSVLRFRSATGILRRDEIEIQMA